MNANECPCCDAEGYEYVSGWQNNEPIEPDEGWCNECGFHYVEHIKNPLSEQVENHKAAIAKAEEKGE